MTLRKTLCFAALALCLALPTLAATAPEAAFEQPRIEGAAGCNQPLSIDRAAEVESIESLVEPVLASVDVELAQGGNPCGTFPSYAPGACTQTCQPCTNSNQCPPFFGINQKCCKYCP